MSTPAPQDVPSEPAPSAPAAMPGTAVPGPAVPATSPSSVADVDLLPDTTADEAGSGWGERDGGFTDEHYLADRPPHHDR